MKTIQQKTSIRYSISFKQMVVKEIEEGHSMESVRKKYDIGGGCTIQQWIKNFGKHHLLNKTVRVEIPVYACQDGPLFLGLVVNIIIIVGIDNAL